MTILEAEHDPAAVAWYASVVGDGDASEAWLWRLRQNFEAQRVAAIGEVCPDPDCRGWIPPADAMLMPQRGMRLCRCPGPHATLAALADRHGVRAALAVLVPDFAGRGVYDA